MILSSHTYDNIVPSDNVINEVSESCNKDVIKDHVIINDVIDKPMRLIKPVICLPKGNIEANSRTKPVVRRSGRDRAPPLPDGTSSNSGSQ